MIYLGQLKLEAVQTLRLTEERDTIAHSTVSSGGETLQDLGRKRAMVALTGVFHGDNAKDNVTSLLQILHKGDPVAFKADGVLVDKTLIRRIVISREAGHQDSYRYEADLEEWQTMSESSGEGSGDIAISVGKESQKTEGNISQAAQQNCQSLFG